jgi:hypothetical protein
MREREARATEESDREVAAAAQRGGGEQLDRAAARAALRLHPRESRHNYVGSVE